MTMPATRITAENLTEKDAWRQAAVTRGRGGTVRPVCAPGKRPGGPRHRRPPVSRWSPGSGAALGGGERPGRMPAARRAPAAPKEPADSEEGYWVRVAAIRWGAGEPPPMLVHAPLIQVHAPPPCRRSRKGDQRVAGTPPAR